MRPRSDSSSGQQSRVEQGTEKKKGLRDHNIPVRQASTTRSGSWPGSACPLQGRWGLGGTGSRHCPLPTPFPAPPVPQGPTGEEGHPGPATLPGEGKLTDHRPRRPPLCGHPALGWEDPHPHPASFQALTHLLPTSVPNEGTESQRVPRGRVRVGTPHRAASSQTPHLCLPTQGASPRAVGVGFSMAGKEHSAACLPPPHPHPALAGKCPLCAAHTAHCAAASIQVGAAPRSPC